MTPRDVDVRAADNSRDAQDHLATMLAEMDHRLEMLQQELESLASPIAPGAAERPPAPLAAAADPEPAPVAPRRPQLAAELPAGLRKRATRQITAIADRRTAPAAVSDPAPRPPEPAPRSITPDSIVRQTILEADEEARRVVEDARQCIAAIAARTRASLERSLASAPATPPSPSRMRGAPTATAPERRQYEGAVSLEAGPFGDIVQLNEFEAALTSVPGVEDVYIRSFERHHAHFELRLVEPRPLIGELQARAPGSLHVIEAASSSIRLEIAVKDETDRAAR
ncbi:MAG: hypothetical protein QOF69_3111 [Solirubrobacteraceae bacterium]|nr:hypothetical protein [Solirubrobacteraceae bacterium]